jgi:hypothetical protein
MADQQAHGGYSTGRNRWLWRRLESGEEHWRRFDGVEVAVVPARGDWIGSSLPPNVYIGVPDGLTGAIVAALIEELPAAHCKPGDADAARTGVFAPTTLFNAPGTPKEWLEKVDRAIPIQRYRALVVREFVGAAVEQVQALRRDGWTFLHVERAATRDFAYTILAEREEWVKPDAELPPRAEDLP